MLLAKLCHYKTSDSSANTGKSNMQTVGDRNGKAVATVLFQALSHHLTHYVLCDYEIFVDLH